MSRRDEATSRRGTASAAPGAVDRVGEWNGTWALAVAFGLASVPWTYAFVAGGGLPLWPSFVASASLFAAGGEFVGLRRSALGNGLGILYAATTLAIVGALGGGPAVLAVVVGAFMLLASLHAFLPRVGFAPAAFLGYATLFGVHAAGAGAFGLPGVVGEAAAAGVAMLLGACIGFGVERLAEIVA